MLTVHWPLYTICPISAAGFYAGYFFVWDALLHRFGPTQYASLGSIAQRCFCDERASKENEPAKTAKIPKRAKQMTKRTS